MKFSITEDGAVRGPKEYMDERGRDLLESILNGEDDQFGVFASQAPDVETAICVRLQTDYAGWKGQREVANKMRS